MTAGQTNVNLVNGDQVKKALERLSTKGINTALLLHKLGYTEPLAKLCRDLLVTINEAQILLGELDECG